MQIFRATKVFSLVSHKEDAKETQRGGRSTGDPGRARRWRPCQSPALRRPGTLTGRPRPGGQDRSFQPCSHGISPPRTSHALEERGSRRSGRCRAEQTCRLQNGSSTADQVALEVEWERCMSNGEWEAGSVVLLLIYMDWPILSSP